MRIYNAEIVAGSLLINETTQLVQLILRGLSEKEIKAAVFVDNVFQKQSTATITRQFRLIRKRVTALPNPILSLIAHGDRETVTQAVLVGAIKHSRLLGDFMQSVLWEKVRYPSKRVHLPALRQV